MAVASRHHSPSFVAGQVGAPGQLRSGWGVPETGADRRHCPAKAGTAQHRMAIVAGMRGVRSLQAFPRGPEERDSAGLPRQGLIGALGRREDPWVREATRDGASPGVWSGQRGQTPLHQQEAEVMPFVLRRPQDGGAFGLRPGAELAGGR